MQKHHRPGPLKIKLDWRAYFRAFCEAHGKEPVLFNGRLLFSDGWQYSSTDYRGPEWKPEDDEREYLIRNYWERRLEIVTDEALVLQRTYEDLRTSSAGRSIPLYQSVVYSDEGKQVRESVPLDLEAIEGRLAWLQEDRQECLRKLREVSHEHPS